MINIRFYEILSSFSKEDWNNFILYIKSFDAISDRKYLPFVIELKSFQNKLSELKNADFSKIFTKAYKKTYNPKTISNRQSELLNLLSNFLNINSYKKNELLQTCLYFNELLSRNLVNQFSRDYKKKKDIIENNYYDENAYKILSEIIGNRSEYFALKNESENSINMFLKSSDVLLAEILTNIYRTAQEFQILNFHNVNKNNQMLNFLETIDLDKFFEELEKQNNPIFIISIIHYYIFKSLQNTNNKKYISKAKRIFFANEKHFPERFKLHIYGKIMSYHNIKLYKGDSENKNFKELFLLYKRKLEQNLVSDFKDHYFIYNNVFCEYVIAGIKTKQYDWVKMVIKKYSPLLPEDIRDDEYTLAMIRLYFEKKEYDKIIEIINNRKIKNKKHYLDSIHYKLKSHYELENFEECYKEIDNVKHYLKNNREKILRIRTLFLKKFLDVFPKLLNFRINPFDKDVNDIFYEFEKLDISKESWIYEKLQEISEKKQ